MMNYGQKRTPATPTSTITACTITAFLLVLAATASAQTAQSLSQVQKIYVEPLGQGTLGNEFRDRVIDRLRKDGHLAVVDASSEADAVVSGSAEIWPTAYASNSPRSRSAARQTIYSGYLSARVIGRNNEVLWSYLVTPRKFAWGGIVHDLADNLTAKLVEARQQTSDAASSSASSESPGFTLHGAGATFPAPLYQKWFQSFHEQQPSHQVTYDPVGSEEGIRQLSEGKVDFAASDMPLSDARLSQLTTKVRQFPTVLGGVVPIYNLPGIGRPLKFEPQVLAEIYLGKIKRWNDPRIRASNHGVNLPDSEITVVHRSDGSGTTYVWSDFLSKVSPEWKAMVGTGSLLKWPVGTGAQHNEGVAVAVYDTPNSIGYVEMVFALEHQLSFGAVRNPAGVFVRADLASLTAAAISAAANMTPDFRVSITHAPGEGSYPIASFTWLLAPESGDRSRRAGVSELVEWILSEGQKQCSELGYAPLPREIVERELAALRTQKYAPGERPGASGRGADPQPQTKRTAPK
jgi:phosphate transport system substrate-binding protein